MRCALVLGASAVLAYLLAQLLHLRVSLVLYAYVGWTLLSTLVAYFALQRIANTERGYAWFFASALAPSVLCSVILAVRFIVSFGWDGFGLIMTTLCFFALVTAKVSDYTAKQIAADIELAQAFVFSLCGVIALCSLIPPCSAVEFRLRLGLGLYWLVIGLYSFVDSVGIVRSRALFESIASWFPACACIVILGLLAFSLSRLQGESARQQIRGQHIVTLEYER